MFELRHNKATDDYTVHVLSLNVEKVDKFTLRQMDLSRSPRFTDVCRGIGFGRGHGNKPNKKGRQPSCLLDDYEEAMADYVVTDPEAACNNSTQETSTEGAYFLEA